MPCNKKYIIYLVTVLLKTELNGCTTTVTILGEHVQNVSNDHKAWCTNKIVTEQPVPK